MIDTTLITLGGKVFCGVASCAQEFDIPEPYVVHMLNSDNYPGCRQLTDEEVTSFLQTLTLIKVRDEFKWMSTLTFC